MHTSAVKRLFDKNQNLCANSGNFPDKYLYKTPFIIDGDICAETVLGSIIMFKREDMIEIGFYDENLFLYFLDDELCKRIRDKKKAVIQVLNARAIHEHGQIKVRNPIKRTYLSHFNLTFDELYYFYKIKKHERLLNELSNKVPKYFLKLLLNIIVLRPNKVAYFFSKIMAFYKFKKIVKKNI